MGKRSIGGEEFHRRVREGLEERRKVVAELFNLHYAELVGRFVHKGLPRQLAEEHGGDVFLRLLRHCEALSATTPPIHWLNRVVTHMICDYYTSHTRLTTHAADQTSATVDRDIAEELTAPDPDARQRTHPAIARNGEDMAERADPDPAAAPDYQRQRRENCAVQAWQRFEEAFPLESELLSAIALDEIDMEELRATVQARSVQAARQRLYTWRRKLREYCLALCGNETCTTTASSGGGHDGR